MLAQRSGKPGEDDGGTGASPPPPLATAPASSLPSKITIAAPRSSGAMVSSRVVKKRSRASMALTSKVADAFRFMEDSPMFRARLAGFEDRSKSLLQKLSSLVKTTERYLASGKIFAKATASLANDFLEMSESFGTANSGTEEHANKLSTLLRTW